MKFKFFSDNTNDNIPITQDEISYALIVGRRAYLNGHPVEHNPFLRQQTFEAFNEGWDLEYSYDILRQARDNAFNNGL